LNIFEARALINLSKVAEQLSQKASSWASEQIGSFNGSQVNVRFMQQAVADWHLHSDTDEMFVVLSGSIVIDTEDGEFPLTQNDCFIVKAGTRHRAKTDGTAMLMTLISKDETQYN
jgi:mannose-6-phosphate isomerase-like protein (cupin superfamily)